MQFTPLTPAQRQEFDARGFLIVRDALDTETIQAILDASDRLLASTETVNRQTDNPHYDGFRNCIALDDAFLPLLTHPKTVPLVVQLLSANLQLCTSHLIYKHPDPPATPATHRSPGWHRDIANTPNDLGHAHIPRMEIKVAYYFTDLSERNSGVTLFAAGSNHLKTTLPFPDGKTDPADVTEPLLNPGDAVLFENRTWHAGGANLSNRIRKAVMFGYGYRWLRPFDYIAQPESLLAKVCPIGKQLLNGLKDPEGRFTPEGFNKPLTDWAAEHGVHPASQLESAI